MAGGFFPKAFPLGKVAKPKVLTDEGLSRILPKSLPLEGKVSPQVTDEVFPRQNGILNIYTSSPPSAELLLKEKPKIAPFAQGSRDYLKGAIFL